MYPQPPLLVRRYGNFSKIEEYIETDEDNRNDPFPVVLPPAIIYHYTNINDAKLILENQTLLFSSPNSFNDPFDMYEGLIDFTPLPNQNKAWINNLPDVKTRRDRKRKQRLYSQRKSGLVDFQRKLIVDMREMRGLLF